MSDRRSNGASFAGHSLRARLIWSLFTVIVVMAAAQAFIAYRNAQDQADASFDYQMRQLAVAFRSGELSRQRAGAIELEELDFVVQVWTSDGRRVYKSTQRRFIPARTVTGFSIAHYGGKVYRVFSLEKGGRRVQVAQDLTARARKARAMALRSAVPLAVLVPLLMFLVWWLVSRSLAPVARVRGQLSRREASDLSPVSAQGLPAEVRPLVVELNALFVRVGDAFEAQQNFVADAAHELRSPLTALKLQIQNLQRMAASSDSQASQQHALRQLDQGVDRASRLLEQLLDLARHQAASNEHLAPTEVDMTELTRELIAARAADALHKNIEMTLDAEPALTIQGWSSALQVMVRNLLDNAIKYTPDRGVVSITLSIDNEHLLWRIDDSGAGIADQDRERALDRFYRGANPGGMSGQPAASIEGSGLGLAIVKNVIRQHGASMSLDQSSELGGLQVRLRLPRQRPG